MNEVKLLYRASVFVRDAKLQTTREMCGVYRKWYECKKKKCLWLHSCVCVNKQIMYLKFVPYTYYVRTFTIYAYSHYHTNPSSQKSWQFSAFFFFSSLSHFHFECPLSHFQHYLLYIHSKCVLLCSCKRCNCRKSVTFQLLKPKPKLNCVESSRILCLNVSAIGCMCVH